MLDEITLQVKEEIFIASIAEHDDSYALTLLQDINCFAWE
jgi:hypothetical protein